MFAKEFPVILEKKQDKDEFLKAVILMSQALEEPIEESVLQDKLIELDGEKWSLELIRSLKFFGFKAKWFLYDVTKDKVIDVPQPFITQLQDGFYIVLQNNEKEFLLYCVRENKTLVMSIEEFKKQWGGLAFLMKPKFKLKHLSSRFNLEWFLSVFWKFKRFCGF